MIKELVVMTVAVVAGASWAAARGPDISERISAVDKLGAGSGSTTIAQAQAAARRSGEGERGYAGETAVPAAATQPAAAPQSSPSYPYNDSHR